MASPLPIAPACPDASGVDVLLTGFEPFDGAASNESWEAVRLTAAELRGAGLDAVALELPVVFDAAGDALVAALARHRPRLAIAVGLAAGRASLTPERVAINVRDARIADNAGHQPVDEPIISGGPVGYFTTLPIKAMVAAVRTELELPAAVSQSAGTFVCNDVFYRLQHALAAVHSTADGSGAAAGAAAGATPIAVDGGSARPLPAGARGGFVHVPAAADLPVEETARALALMARVALRTEEDLQVTGGSVA